MVEYENILSGNARACQAESVLHKIACVLRSEKNLVYFFACAVYIVRMTGVYSSHARAEHTHGECGHNSQNGTERKGSPMNPSLKTQLERMFFVHKLSGNVVRIGGAK